MLKNFTGSGSWKYKWVLALGFLGASGAALAVPCDVSPTSPCDVPFSGSWLIGEDSSVVIPAGQWVKNLAGAEGTTSGDVVVLVENLILTSGVLTSWTETILSSNWVWIDDLLDPDDYMFVAGGPFGGSFGGSPLGGGTATVTFSGFSLDPTQIDPDTGNPQGPIDIIITKKMRCIGATEDCNDPFSVVENSVPEPGTLLLLAGGLAGLAGLRRRRYA